MITTKLIPAEPTLVTVDMNCADALFEAIEHQGFTVSRHFTIGQIQKLSYSQNDYSLDKIHDVEDAFDDAYGDLEEAYLVPAVIEVNAKPDSVIRLDREIIEKQIGKPAFICSEILSIDGKPHKEQEEWESDIEKRNNDLFEPGSIDGCLLCGNASAFRTTNDKMYCVIETINSNLREIWNKLQSIENGGVFTIKWALSDRFYQDPKDPAPFSTHHYGLTFDHLQLVEMETNVICLVLQRNDQANLRINLLASYPDEQSDYAIPTGRDLAEDLKRSHVYQLLWPSMNAVVNHAVIQNPACRLSIERKTITAYVKSRTPGFTHHILIEEGKPFMEMRTYADSGDQTKAVPTIYSDLTQQAVGDALLCEDNTALFSVDDVRERFRADYPREYAELTKIESDVKNPKRYHSHR